MNGSEKLTKNVYESKDYAKIVALTSGTYDSGIKAEVWRSLDVTLLQCCDLSVMSAVRIFSFYTFSRPHSFRFVIYQILAVEAEFRRTVVHFQVS